jgi:hypothetical protein
MAAQATLPIEQAEMVAAIRFVIFLGSLGVHRYEMPSATNSDRNGEQMPENMKRIIKTCMYVFLRGKGYPIGSLLAAQESGFIQAHEPR